MTDQKTDVIFLGAGASSTAGFPVNRELADYMVEGMLTKTRDISFPTSIVKQWEHYSAVLRKTAFLSVDEFCELSSKPNDVLNVKKMLSVALFDHSHKWASKANKYRHFIETLFIKPATVSLNPQFSIVNFNYDGVLGKLLTDAVSERRTWAGQAPLESDEMAIYAGGHFQDQVGGVAKRTVANLNYLGHYMPHGTMSVVMSDGREVCRADTIYHSDLRDKQQWFVDGYRDEPLIHFPWEPKRSEFREQQISRAAECVYFAKRIHFIGMSGHPLMRSSLRDIFQSGWRDKTIMEKNWHVACPGNAKETFLRIAECFMPEALDGNTRGTFLNRATASVTSYVSFEDWISQSPHLVE